MSLLPSSPDAEPAEDAGPRVIGVDSEDADAVLSALSSGTARRLLSELHDEPAPPSALADRVDTSLQNAQYHLEKLETAGAVEVVDTAYSAKGREMDVYAPADQPLVIFAGNDEGGSTLRTALKRLLGAVGILGVASLVVQALVGREPLLRPPSFGAGGDAGDGAGGADGAGGDGGGGGEADFATAPTGGGRGGADSGAVGGDGGATATPTAQPTGVADSASPTAAPTEAPGTLTGEPASTPMPTGTEEAVSTVQQTATEVFYSSAEATTDAARTAADGASGSGLPPGALFFAGGLFVLAVVTVVFLATRG